MTILLTVVLVLVGIVALLMIAALFIKKEYSFRTEITIRKPLEEVFDYVKHLRNQDDYSKWVMTDPSMKKEFRGRDGTVGFIYAWDGNKEAGKGEQEIIDIKQGALVDVQIRFERPFKSVARTPIRTERITETETRVTWGMEGRSNYPMNLMTAIVKGALIRDLDLSLRNLKKNLEEKHVVRA